MSSSASASRAPVLRRSPWCLLAASCWALLPVSSPRGGVSVDAWSYLALVGAGLFTLLLVALSFDGARDAHAPQLPRALSLGLGLACLPSAALAYWLHVGTNHRPLGAATYSVFAFGAGVLGVWAAHRTYAWAARSRAGRQGLRAQRLLGLLGVTTLVFVVLRAFVREAPGSVALALEAGLGAALSALMLALPVTPRLAQAARWTTPACAVLCLLTLGLLRFEADVRATVKSAPVIAGAFGLALR